jgi:hypothetical protein
MTQIGSYCRKQAVTVRRANRHEAEDNTKCENRSAKKSSQEAFVHVAVVIVFMPEFQVKLLQSQAMFCQLTYRKQS